MAHIDNALLWHVSLLLAGIMNLEHSKNYSSFTTEFCDFCYLQESRTHWNSKSYLEAANRTENGVYKVMSALESVQHGVEATGDRKDAV